VHEVRNPLTTVMMGLNALHNTQLDERNTMRLGLALGEAQRLESLLNEILLYAKPQTLQTTSVNLAQLTRDVVATLQAQPLAQNRSIVLKNLPQNILVQGDADKLKQVLINLIGNACEAIDPGNTVTCHLEETLQQVHLRIHNGGTPIPADILPKLTQPFFTTKNTGTGLGLPIVKRIVEAHQGLFKIESTTGNGTTTTVTLNTLPNGKYLDDAEPNVLHQVNH
ncbi:MAG: HAMP domain-containing sensor histidine kinase, partial [Cyanobacteria bacterium P01_D01_bin.56]